LPNIALRQPAFARVKRNSSERCGECIVKQRLSRIATRPGGLNKDGHGRQYFKKIDWRGAYVISRVVIGPRASFGNLTREWEPKDFNIAWPFDPFYQTVSRGIVGQQDGDRAIRMSKAKKPFF
jgi:hypothetical protein